MSKRKNIRNIAIIAHVDHGKTTLVDALLKATGVFRENQEVQDRVMDSGDIEKERGITILSKNTAIEYKGTKINIIDTPGHADFGGEVERVLNMVDGVVLVVDAFEGPMPQTKFVLSQAFDLKLRPIVVLNKIDRPNARPEAVIDEIIELFIELDADESALDAPIVYASALGGYASLDPNEDSKDMTPLLDTIIENIDGPEDLSDEPLSLLISTIDYSDYVGKIGIGKIEQGTIEQGKSYLRLNYNDSDLQEKIKITNLYEFQNLDRVEVGVAKSGEVVAVSGIENINIGDTIADEDHPHPIEFSKISEPTLSINFGVNSSPFAGQDGKYLTSRQIRDRLYRETKSDVSLRVEDTDSPETFKVSGRGELHLSILIENMRREGYEFQIGKPQVLFKEEDGKTLEPMEIATIDVDSEYVGPVMEKLGMRKGNILSMDDNGRGSTRLKFSIPSRGLIGYRQVFLTDTKGTGVINSEFDGYEPFKGEIPKRQMASIVSFDKGIATAYGLFNAQKRGELFIEPGTPVYEGMIVGQSPRGLELEISVTKEKKLSNVREKSSDDALTLSPVVDMTLENALEFIEEDELIEVTPESMRLRKSVLNTQERKRHRR